MKLFEILVNDLKSKEWTNADGDVIKFQNFGEQILLVNEQGKIIVVMNSISGVTVYPNEIEIEYVNTYDDLDTFTVCEIEEVEI